MNDNERIQLQIHKDFYESEWNKEQTLRLEEHAKRLELESEVAALKLGNQNLIRSANQLEQIPLLSQERDALRTELESVKHRLSELDTLETLKNEFARIQKELAAIQRRVSRQNFWQDVAREFAEEIEDFPTINGSSTQEPDKTILAAFEEWHLEMMLGVEDALNGQSTIEKLSKNRKLLIAQWVLLRWFEISGVVQ
jgi:uncharacterized protein YydD (DUF2326 family)